MKKFESIGNVQPMLTMRDVAERLHVAPRTAAGFFDRNMLRGFKIPGTQDRRIPLDDFNAFALQHGVENGHPDEDVYVIMTELIEGTRERMERELQGLAAISLNRSSIYLVENGFKLATVMKECLPQFTVLDQESVNKQTFDGVRRILGKRRRKILRFSPDRWQALQDLQEYFSHHVLKTSDVFEEGEEIPDHLLRNPSMIRKIVHSH